MSDVPVKVTVIDNGPGEASKRLQLPREVDVVSVGSNAGYAGGANIGLNRWLEEEGSGYCIVGSHDLHVTRSTFRVLMQTADRDSDIGILGPSITPAGAGRLLGVEGDVELREWVSGTCMLLRRRCIADIGLFDASLHSYCEDMELGLRALNAGYKVGTARNARAHGLGSRVDDAPLRWGINKFILAVRAGGRPAALQLAFRNLWQAFQSAVAIALTHGARRAAHRKRVSSLLRSTTQGLRRAQVFRRRTR